MTTIFKMKGKYLDAPYSEKKLKTLTINQLLFLCKRHKKSLKNMIINHLLSANK